MPVSRVPLRYLLVAALLICTTGSVYAQDLDTIDVCVFIPSGEHPEQAVVQFLDPATGDVLQDSDGGMRSYTLASRGCVSGAGVVSTETVPEVVRTDMTIYPNPARDAAIARWAVDSGYRHGYVRMMDILGREIARSSVRATRPGSYRATVSAGSLAGGLYFIQFLADGQVRQSGRFIHVGNADRGSIAEISFETAGDALDAAPDRRGVRFAGKRTGEVRVRVVALGHRIRERTFTGVQDGARLSVLLDEANPLDVYALDMTHHREPISTGMLTVRELHTGFEQVIPFNGLPVTVSALSDSMSMRVEADGFTNGVQAVRPGEPGDYSAELSGATFDPETAPILYIAPDYEGPITLGAVPDRMIEDGSLRLYIRRYSGIESGWVYEWRPRAHTVIDLESFSMTRHADDSIPNDRVASIYRFVRSDVGEPVPDTLFSLVATAFDRLADVVNERTFYQYRGMEDTGTSSTDAGYGVALDDDISGVGDYRQRFTGNSNNLRGLHLLFEVDDNLAGETRTTLAEVMGTLAHARLYGNQSTDSMILLNELYLQVSGIDLKYRPLVGDFMAMQAFIRPVVWGFEYGTNPVRGVFHTVPESLSKSGAF